MTFETINEDRHGSCNDPECEACQERRRKRDAAQVYWDRLDELIRDDERDEDIQQQYRMC